MAKYAENYFKITIKSLVDAWLYNVSIPQTLHMQFSTEEENQYLQAFVVPGKNYFDITFMFWMVSQSTRIIYTRPNYWWKRPWFECPITQEKATILFWNWKEIWSRKWLDLRYVWEHRDNLFLYLDINRDFRTILWTIKYPYRNGKPTRKFKKVIRGYRKVGLREENAYEDLLFTKYDSINS